MTVTGLSDVLGRISEIQGQVRNGPPRPTDMSPAFAQLLSAASASMTGGALGASGTMSSSTAPATGDGITPLGLYGAGGILGATGPAGAGTDGTDPSGLPGGTSLNTGQAAAADATKYLGVPYVWGGTDPATGLDCSGLVQRVYADLGITLPRVAADQAQAGVAVPSLAQALPGDLVTFGQPADHIGIYLGNGMMIDAPHAGAAVRVEAVGTPTAIRRIAGTAEAGAAEVAGGDPLAGLDAAPVDATLSASSPGSGASPYDALFAQATQRYGLPAGLLAAVARTESNDNPAALSPAGAQGLMQLMPGTAAGLDVNPLDPAQAIDGAARILAGNLRTFGTVPLALAAYNAGAGAVEQYGGIPPYPETQNYVNKVMTLAGLSA